MEPELPPIDRQRARAAANQLGNAVEQMRRAMQPGSMPRVPTPEVPRIPVPELPKVPELPRVPTSGMPKLPDMPRMPNPPMPRVPGPPNLPLPETVPQPPLGPAAAVIARLGVLAAAVLAVLSIPGDSRRPRFEEPVPEPPLKLPPAPEAVQRCPLQDPAAPALPQVEPPSVPMTPAGLPAAPGEAMLADAVKDAQEAYQQASEQKKALLAEKQRLEDAIKRDLEQGLGAFETVDKWTRSRLAQVDAALSQVDQELQKQAARYHEAVREANRRKDQALAKKQEIERKAAEAKRTAEQKKAEAERMAKQVEELFEKEMEEKYYQPMLKAREMLDQGKMTADQYMKKEQECLKQAERIRKKFNKW